MTWTKEQEIKDHNQLVNCKIAWLLKKKGFDIPCLNGYNARMEQENSDGTWFFDNSFMREAAAPTKGLLKYWLEKYYDLYINYKLKDEDFINALNKLPDNEKTN